jgi:D-alanine-D-alanine ligase
MSNFKGELESTGEPEMRASDYSSDIPVLLIYNLDPKWSAQEQAGVIDVTSQVGQALSITGHPTTLVPVTSNDLDSVLSGYNPLEYIIFNWCEGLPGVHDSEAIVVEYLEQHNYTFTGATSATLQLAADKCRVKRLLDEAGILTPSWETYEKSSSINWKNFPAIVKPSREHCSQGIHRNAVVTTEARLKNRIRYIIKRFQHPALVENFINGRELHISLWGDGEIEMLPPAEMEFPPFEDQYDRVCTYESKFVPESKQYKNIKTVLPAPLSENELRDLEQICKAAYLLMECRDYARIDLRMKDGLFYILDINPNADICPDTSTIAAAEMAGYTYKDFLGRLVLLAAQRHYKKTDELTVPVRRFVGN